MFPKLRSMEPVGGTTVLTSEKYSLGDEVLSERVRFSGQETGRWPGGGGRLGQRGEEGMTMSEDGCQKGYWTRDAAPCVTGDTSQCSVLFLK